jgi:hypothetical protein
MLANFLDWNKLGIIPPIPADPLLATSYPRSPYVVTWALFHRFRQTPSWRQATLVRHTSLH